MDIPDPKIILDNAKGSDAIEQVELDLLKAEFAIDALTHKVRARSLSVANEVENEYLTAKKAGNSDTLAKLSNQERRDMETKRRLGDDEQYTGWEENLSDMKWILRIGQIKLGYLHRDFDLHLPVMQKLNLMRAERICSFDEDGNLHQRDVDDVEINAVSGGSIDEVIELLTKKRDAQARKEAEQEAEADTASGTVTEAADVQYI